MLFYCLTFFATGLTTGLLISEILYPGTYLCVVTREKANYYRFFSTVIYVCLTWVFFLIGLSMIQLGYSFGIIFHQGRAKAAKIRLIVFVIGFSVFIITGLIVTIILVNEEESKRNLIGMCAKFSLSFGTAILNTCVLCWLH